MRQAGRYLPEYRDLRSRTKSFLDFCYSPAMASEATLQPVRRFGMDGAIIFSDILVVPHALGVEVRFEEGKGPVLGAVRSLPELDRLGLGHMKERLSPVYEALRMTRRALPAETALIGFCGSPWTLACYVVEGGGSRDFQEVRSIALRDEVFFSRLIDILADAVAGHAVAQIDAGAEVIQLFDSWAGCLSEPQFAKWVIVPTRKIIQSIKKKYPTVPIIGFPRQAGSKFADYVSKTGVDAVNIDNSLSLAWAKKELQPLCVLQGNLDPVALADNQDAALAQAAYIVEQLSDKPFVFNLGHGILPHTPIAHVQALCDFLKRRER